VDFEGGGNQTLKKRLLGLGGKRVAGESVAHNLVKRTKKKNVEGGTLGGAKALKR